MLFRTPKNKTSVWIIALLLFFLIPISFYLTEKALLENSDVYIEGASATRTLIGWFIVLLIMTPFVMIFTKWALKEYKANEPFLIFDFKRRWWSSFWTFLFAFWIYIEIYVLVRVLNHFYYPEAFQLVAGLLLFYLNLCLWVNIIHKKRELGSDILMVCVALLLTGFTHFFVFSQL